MFYVDRPCPQLCRSPCWYNTSVVNVTHGWERVRAIGKELFSIDTRSLACARFGLGTYIVVDLVLRVPHIAAFYTTGGVYPRLGFLSDFAPSWAWSLHTFVDNVWWIAALFIIHGICGLFVALGYRTRIATIGALVLSISLGNANPLVNYGIDIMARILLFLGVFLDWGQAYSVDARGRGSPRVVCSPWSAVALLQVTGIYFFASLHKSGVEWMDGTAVGYVVAYSRFSTVFGEWLGSFPLITMVLTYGVKVFQRVVPFLLFFPRYTAAVRVGTIVMLVLMHLGFALSLKLGLFPFVSILNIILFIPEKVWDTFEQFSPRRLRDALVRHRAKTRELHEGSIATRPAKTYVLAVLAGTYCALVLVWNIYNVRADRGVEYQLRPTWLTMLVQPIGIAQRWAFFAPDVERYEEWPVVEVKGVSEVPVDPLSGWQEVTFERPRDSVSTYGTVRWSAYFDEVSRMENRRLMRAAARYYCNVTRRRFTDNLAPVNVRVWWMREEPHDAIDSQGQQTPYKKHFISEYEC